MSEVKTAAIALFVYNRPRHTEKTIGSLQKNTMARESDLFIFSDGPKSNHHQGAVDAVRNQIKNVIGFKSVSIVESPTNKGLATSIIEGVSRVLQEREEIIVLEDDMITSPYFLSYMNQGLNLYRDEQKVISIHGYMYPVKGNLPETFFLRGAHCWGWATWKRGWSLFEIDGRKLLERLTNEASGNRFDYDGSIAFVQMLRDQIDKRNDSWAVRWHATAFLNGMLTLYPSRPVLKNIGFDNSGVHSGTSHLYDVKLDINPVTLSKIAIEENKVARDLLVAFFRSIQRTLLRRIRWKLTGMVRRFRSDS